MDQRRLKLQMTLEKILGSRNVYFQPPETIKMKYPCIVYNLDDMDSIDADNIKYCKHDVYSVTIIDRDPESAIRNGVYDMPFCEFQRFYTSDNLNHWTFRLYF